MNNKQTTFKITLIAAGVLAATQAHSALYDIINVTPEMDAQNYYGRSIQKDGVSGNPLGCFASDSNCTEFIIAGDTRQGVDGLSYKDEVPFRKDNQFVYQERYDIERYCYYELGYSTCDAWADEYWYGIEKDGVILGGLERERNAWDNGTYTSNASSFVDGIKTIPNVGNIVNNLTAVENTQNTIISGLDNSIPFGITSSGYAAFGKNYALGYRQRGFYGSDILNPPTNTNIVTDTNNRIVEKMGRTFAYDVFDDGANKFIVGSTSVTPYLTNNSNDNNKDYNGDVSKCVNDNVEPQTTRYCQNFAFSTQAYIWDTNDLTTGYRVTKWVGDVVANRKGYSAQASVRAAAVPAEGTYANKAVMVGFNTFRDNNDYRMQATVFYPNENYSPTATNDMWDTTLISGAQLKVSGDVLYSNSLATDINNNLILIGESKRRGDKPEKGASANRVFVADASNGKPVATYLSDNVFFAGAGGKANAINNYNEIVGQVDAENAREDGGKERRHRGFISPFDGNGSNPERLALFKNQSWLLDDLTNDNDISGNNNQYRILEASDINDDGVIAATALMCEGGYDDTSHNSYCSGKTEKIVAVKLVPVAGASAEDINLRGSEEESVERKGASSSVFSIILLSFFGLRRRLFAK